MNLETMDTGLIQNLVVMYAAIVVSFLALLVWFLQKRKRSRGKQPGDTAQIPNAPLMKPKDFQFRTTADAAAFFIGIVAAVQLFRFYPIFGALYTVVFAGLYVLIYFYGEKGL